MADPKTPNQTPDEFFALVGTGRRGVEDMLSKMGPEIRKIGAPNVTHDEAFDIWSKRALVEVSTNDALRDIIATKPGIFSIYQALAKSANMGLQFGGHFPQAYLVPKGGKAVLIVSEEGLSYISTYGPGAVLQVKPELHLVHENDKFTIDDAARTYVHVFTPFAERGKLLGYFTVLEYKDGRRQIPYILQSKVLKIAEGYGQADSPAYRKSPEEMHRKIAMKALLRPVARESEGLAMALSLEELVDAEPAPAMRTVSERVGERLERTLDAQPAPEAAPAEEAKPATAPDPQPAAQAAGAAPAKKGDLF